MPWNSTYAGKSKLEEYFCKYLSIFSAGNRDTDDGLVVGPFRADAFDS